MKTRATILFILFAFGAYAQNIQSEINTQVWKPFIKSFNDRDTDLFMSVHSKEVVRSPRDSKAVWNWDQYYRQQLEGDKRERSEQSRRSLELRFTERVANENLAVEVGVYKTSYVNKAGKAQSYYGRFHVVLRKESGTWKILVDTDSSEGGQIGEKDFLAGASLD